MILDAPFYQHVPKPCPFCSSPADLVKRLTFVKRPGASRAGGIAAEVPEWFVMCRGCKANIGVFTVPPGSDGYQSEESAVKAWNTRVA